MDEVLKLIKINKKFDNFRLNDINFDLRKGSVTGFIGVNGSGKTTVIKSILGLISTDSGWIELFGEKISDNNEIAFKNRIGFVLDEGYFYDDIKLRDMKNIVAPAYDNWDENIFNTYIEIFKLPLDQEIHTLSKGMRMKFALSLALSHNAELLIMDEPTSGLDPLVRAELMEILSDFMKDRNRSVLFSTHITSDLDKIADDIILINEGRILFSGQKDKLLETYIIVSGDKIVFDTLGIEQFLKVHVTNEKFQGIMNRDIEMIERIKNIKGVEIKDPFIEDIMLMHINVGSSNEVV